MDELFISGRDSVSDAQNLMRDFGAQAALEAAVRAEKSRGAENVLKFCHWRQVERLIDALAAREAPGSIH